MPSKPGLLAIGCLAVLLPAARHVAAQSPPAQTEPGGDAGKGTSPKLLEAQALFDSGHYGESEKTALEALQESPRSARAMYLLGHSLERLDRPKESLAWFTRAAALAKPAAEDLRTVALDYVLLDDYPDAVHWLERAVAFDPDDAEAWYDLARAHMMQGNFSAAEVELRRSLSLKPMSVKAENNLGVTYEGENRLDEAEKAYRTAIAWQAGTAQQSAQPYLNLGTLLVTEQHGREASALLEKAVELDPADTKAHEQYARALEQTGEMAKAVSEMQRAVKLDEKNARLHFELGQLYRRAGDAEQARQELQLSGRLYGEHSTSPDH